MARGWNNGWRYWRRFNLPNIVYILILLAIMALSYWYVRKDAAEQAAPPPKQSDRMDGFAQQAELTQTSKDGTLLYHAAMTDIEHFGNSDLKGKAVYLIATGDKQPRVTVHANQAIWRGQAQVVELSGQVILTREAEANDPNSRPMVLQTEHMTVDMAQGLASSDDAFTMTQGASVLNGKRFRYDYQLRDLSMGGADGGRIKAQIVNAGK